MTRTLLTPITCQTLALLAAALVCADHADAQTTPRFSALVEGATVWSRRNDVRIPPDTGTEFSIVDLIGAAPTPIVRVELTAGLAERHELRFVYAPIEVSGRGVPSVPIAFAGGQFVAGVAAEADYKFSSYRATYRYRFYNGDRWQWQVGFTGFVRDARIALAQPGVAAEDTDLGFVPLGHIKGRAKMSDRLSLMLELDGTAAPQGRAFDFAAMLDYHPTPRWTLGGGYRTIEGGADVNRVYTFAWLNALVARAGVAF